MAVTGFSVRGTRHLQTGDPCQDAWYSIPLEGGMVVAVADGLSSASHARQGARIAVFETCQIVASGEDPEVPPKAIIRTAAGMARDSLYNAAAASDLPPSRFATTLIVAYISGDCLTIGHIGDGIVVGIQEGQPLILSPPARTEYANETASLVQPDWESQFRIVTCKSTECCIIATDGCQGALSLRNGGNYLPYEPFILPLASFVRKKVMNNGDCAPDIENLLLSPRMQNLSDDDKTLVVLVRLDG